MQKSRQYTRYPTWKKYEGEDIPSCASGHRAFLLVDVEYEPQTSNLMNWGRWGEGGMGRKEENNERGELGKSISMTIKIK